MDPYQQQYHHPQQPQPPQPPPQQAQAHYQGYPQSMGAGDNRPRVMFNKAHSVWMGDVEPFMNDEFIKQQFEGIGLKVMNVRIMQSNKFQDQNLTYAFIELEDEKTAIRTVQRYNEKPLPGDPRRKFKLNYTCQSQIKQAQDENGLFVGELSPDVDDLTLFSCFQERYPSVKWAKVIKDQNMMSKGFGFVKFSHDEEYQAALTEMNGYTGLGTNALRVSVATPKERRANPNGNQWNHNNNSNPMVAQHQQHMQYFNQSTAGFQNQSDYYNYYYPQSGAYYQQQHQQQPHHHHQQHQPHHQYYNQHMRPTHDKSRYQVDRSHDLEDQGDNVYSILKDRLVSTDLQSEIEASAYSDVPLIVK